MPINSIMSINSFMPINSIVPINSIMHINSIMLIDSIMSFNSIMPINNIMPINSIVLYVKAYLVNHVTVCIIRREFMQGALFTSELERLHMSTSVSAFQACKKEGLVKSLWRNHMQEPRVSPRHKMSYV